MSLGCDSSSVATEADVGNGTRRASYEATASAISSDVSSPWRTQSITLAVLRRRSVRLSCSTMRRRFDSSRRRVADTAKSMLPALLCC